MNHVNLVSFIHIIRLFLFRTGFTKFTGNYSLHVNPVSFIHIIRLFFFRQDLQNLQVTIHYM